MIVPLLLVLLPHATPAPSPAFTVGVGGTAVAVEVQCKKERCAFFLGAKNNPKKKTRLEWDTEAAATSMIERRGIRVGAANAGMDVTTQTVRLDRGLTGVLVTQHQTGDRNKSRHELFVVKPSGLKSVWQQQEARAGRTKSRVFVVDVNNDGKDEFVAAFMDNPDEAIADTLSVTTYSWRREVQRPVENAQLVPQVIAAILGYFKSVPEARDFSSRPCLEEALILDDTGATLLDPGTVLVAFLALHKSEAELILENAKACDNNLLGAIKPVRPGMEVAESDSE
jgi:hypothetical protein